MKSLILHIGSTKTGTSSLQRFLAGNAEQLEVAGAIYPRSGLVGSPRIAHHNLCYQFQPGRVRTGVFRPEAGTWDDALAELEASPAPVGIVSSEAFMNCKPQQVPRFADVLRDRDVTVVAYVRRQDRWLESAWNQSARFGRASLDFWEFFEGIRRRDRGDYHQLLAPWAEALGTDNMLVRNFDALPASGIIPDFLATLLGALDVPEPLRAKAAGDVSDRRNQKAGIKQLLAVHMITEKCREQLGAEFRIPATSAIRIAEFFREGSGESDRFRALSLADAERILEIFAESNAALAATYPTFAASGGFVAPRPDEYADHVAVAELDDRIFDRRERSFVTRMAREVVRAVRARPPVDGSA